MTADMNTDVGGRAGTHTQKNKNRKTKTIEHVTEKKACTSSSSVLYRCLNSELLHNNVEEQDFWT